MPVGDNDFKCYLCEKECNNFEAFVKHAKSKKHMIKMKELVDKVNDMEQFKPKNIEFQPIEYEFNDNEKNDLFNKISKFRHELEIRTLPLKNLIDQYSAITKKNFKEEAPDEIKNTTFEDLGISDNPKLTKSWYNIKKSAEVLCWTLN